jgi:hypothetical protein
VLQISDLATEIDLRGVDRQRPLARQMALLRNMPEDHHPLIARLARPVGLGGAVKEYEITSGSIGLSMSRLWKGEVGLHALTAGIETPWDAAPLLGICGKLGMVWLRPDADGTALEEYEPLPSEVVYRRDHDTVVVHRANVAELLAA